MYTAIRSNLIKVCHQIETNYSRISLFPLSFPIEPNPNLHPATISQADSDQDESERTSRSRQSSTVKSGTPAPSQQKKPTRSASSESSDASESSSASPVPAPARVEESSRPKSSILKNVEPARNTASPTSTSSSPTEKKPFQSRFLQPQPQSPQPAEKKEESESSSEEETSSEEDSDEEEEEEVPKPAPRPTPTVTPTPSAHLRTEQPSSPLLSRVQAREAATADTRKNSREETRPSGYSSPTSYHRSNYERDESPKYGSPSSSSSALRSRTTAHVEPEPENKYGSSG